MGHNVHSSSMSNDLEAVLYNGVEKYVCTYDVTGGELEKWLATKRLGNQKMNFPYHHQQTFCFYTYILEWKSLTFSEPQWCETSGGSRKGDNFSNFFYQPG